MDQDGRGNYDRYVLMRVDGRFRVTDRHGRTRNIMFLEDDRSEDEFDYPDDRR